MDHHLKPQVRMYANLDALSRAAADEVVRVIVATLVEKKCCDLALAGGNTPRRLYEILASDCAERVPWASVHWFWGDERYVTPADPQSNYGMARQTLLDPLAIPAENVQPMPTHFDDPKQAALEYENLLKKHFPLSWPKFDLVLLGMGADGHTASLYPGSPALDEQERWVVAAVGSAEPRQRLTLTLPVLNHARHVFFLLAGKDKREALRTILHQPDAAVGLYPAARVQPTGPLVWFLDEEAAGSRNA